MFIKKLSNFSNSILLVNESALNAVLKCVIKLLEKEILDDIALITGATVIDEDLGDDLDLITIEHLGTCTKSISKANETLIQVEEMPPSINDLINSIQAKLDSETNAAIKQKHDAVCSSHSSQNGMVEVGLDARGGVSKRSRVGRMWPNAPATLAGEVISMPV